MELPRQNRSGAEDFGENADRSAPRQRGRDTFQSAADVEQNVANRSPATDWPNTPDPSSFGAYAPSGGGRRALWHARNATAQARAASGKPELSRSVHEETGADPRID